MGTSGLVDAFRQLFPGAPVLVCSGHIQADVLRARIREGEYAFVNRGLRIAMLAVMLFLFAALYYYPKA